MAEQSGKKRQITEAAIRLFAKRGFDVTSVQEIALAADVAKGTVYLYFPSKEALIESVCDSCFRLELDACNEGLEKESSSLDKLCRRFDNIMNFMLEHREEARIVEMYSAQPFCGYVTGGLIRELYEDIDAVIAQGIESGEVKDLPSPLLSRLYYGFASAMYQTFRDTPERWNDPTLRAQCHTLIRECLARGQGAPVPANAKHEPSR